MLPVHYLDAVIVPLKGKRSELSSNPWRLHCPISQRRFLRNVYLMINHSPELIKLRLSPCQARSPGCLSIQSNKERITPTFNIAESCCKPVLSNSTRMPITHFQFRAVIQQNCAAGAFTSRRADSSGTLWPSLETGTRHEVKRKLLSR